MELTPSERIADIARSILTLRRDLDIPMDAPEQRLLMNALDDLAAAQCVITAESNLAHALDRAARVLEVTQ